MSPSSSPPTMLAAMATVLVASVGPASAFLLPRAVNTSVLHTVPLTNIGNQQFTAPVEMGSSNPQQFGFALSTTVGYTVVAGSNCSTCSSDSSAPTYNPGLSTSYQPPPATAANGGVISTTLNGKNVTGVAGVENCALKQTDGNVWQYNDQPIIVAGSDSSPAAVPGSGLAGFGQSAVATPTDSLLGNYIAQNGLNSFVYGMALNPLSSNAQNGEDSSGGTLTVFQLDNSLYTGTVGTTNVVSQSQGNFGSVPQTLGSFDWSVAMTGWTFSPGGSGKQVTGGSGTLATIEPNYPFILLTQQDADNIYGSISGSQQYTVPANAVTSSGVAYFQDPAALSWTVPCSDTSFQLTVTVAGVTITIPSNNLVTKVGDQCVGNIKGWADSSRTTYILGSSFMTSAYVIFTATPGAQQNTIGFATRPFATKSSKSNAGAIAGGVIGGIAFIILVAVGVWWFLSRRNRTAPSAEFNPQGVPMDDEKGGFSLFGRRQKNSDNLAAEPWMGPAKTEAEGGDVTVAPWTPNAPTEQAFLSPMGTTFTGAASQTNEGSTTAASHYSGPTPPPPGASPSPQPGFDNYGRPTSGGYTPVPNTGQAMWVERS